MASRTTDEIPPPEDAVAIDTKPAVADEQPAEATKIAPPPEEPKTVEPEPQPKPEIPKPEPPAPVDPGARRLVDMIVTALADGDDASAPSPRIALGGWMNRSRVVRQDEFQALRRRAVSLLRAAGDAQGLQFEMFESGDTTHRLEATAYLLSDGDETWELYVRLVQQENRELLWEPEYPVRMPRFPKDGEDQIILPD